MDARFAFLRPLTFGPLPAGDALGDFLPFDLGLDLGFDFRLEPRVRDRLVPVCELPIRVTQRVSLRRRIRVLRQPLTSALLFLLSTVRVPHSQRCIARGFHREVVEGVLN